jgi:hypothetical protein
MRLVKIYVFDRIDDDGMAHYDEIVVDACWLADRPTRSNS